MKLQSADPYLWSNSKESLKRAWPKKMFCSSVRDFHSLNKKINISKRLLILGPSKSG